MMGEKATLFKALILSGIMDVDAAGISVKVNVHYPGRSALSPTGQDGSSSALRDRQKSAEGIVRSIDRTEGPNMSYR